MRSSSSPGTQELPEGVRRGGESARNPHPAAGELADHFSKRRILAADLIDVAHSHIIELQNELIAAVGGVLLGHDESPS
jgi:hypothetical protein